LTDVEEYACINICYEFGTSLKFIKYLNELLWKVHWVAVLQTSTIVSNQQNVDLTGFLDLGCDKVGPDSLC